MKKVKLKRKAEYLNYYLLYVGAIQQPPPQK
jgi:hypothetical protein